MKKWRIVFVIFAAALIVFIGWNMNRAGMMEREHDSIIARADHLIERSERSLARWNHGH